MSIKSFLYKGLLVILPFSAMATENCNCIPNSVALDGRASDQEIFNAGSCSYICDKDLGGNYGADECPYNAVIVKGSVAQYCYDDSGYTDPWRNAEVQNCTDTDFSRYQKGELKVFGSFLVGKNYIIENGVAVSKTKSAYGNRNYNYDWRLCKVGNTEQLKCLSDRYAEWKGGVCSCRTPENGHSYRWDSKQGKCVEAGAATGGCNYRGKVWPVGKITDCPTVKQNANAEKAETICNADGTVTECKITCPTARPRLVNGKCVAGSPSPTPTNPTVSCRDGRTTLNGKACCDTGTLGTYNQSNDTCTCKNDLEFVIESGTGYCRAKSGTPTFTCPATQLTWVANLKISCGTNTEIQSKIEMIETYCRGTGVSETAFNEYIAQLMDLSAKLCGGASDEQKMCDKISDAHMIGDTCTCNDKNKELNRTTQRCEESAAAIAEREQAASKARITSITGKLNSLKAGLSTSVWKNKEGNFNTSRLVSDSVAGVVLGTAGGLITSNVIKKNQIKGGFEDINCTVRGQVVAGYGDDFQVGIQ